MKKLAFMLLLSCSPASAQMTLMNVENSAAAGGGYQGPGDVVSGAIGWWGLRCYNAAYAGNVADVWDSATGVTTETLITCSAGGTLNTSTPSPIATTCSGGCRVKILYDQSGFGHNATQGANGSRPIYTQSCPGLTGRPCLTYNGSTALGVDTTSLGVITQAWTMSCVGERTTAGATSQLFADNANGYGFLWTSGANAFEFFAGTVLNTSAAVNDNVFHAIQGVASGGSSIISIEGLTNIATGPAGAGSLTGTSGGIQLGSGSFGPMTGQIAECGLWNLSFSNPGNITAMNSNQHAYWGF